MPPYDIRLFGDPVLKQPASEVTELDGRLAALVEDMAVTMYEAPGVGLAAPQVGVPQRLFVYDLQDGLGARELVNPVVVESDGEWFFEEGCLSVPGLSWEIVRPKTILLRGYDIHGNEVELEADEYAARVFQHEMDHLDGVLLLDRLDTDTRKQALRTLRNLMLDGGLRRQRSDHLL